MCDTAVFFCRDGTGRSIFGKNSDRDKGEPQIIYLSTNPVGEFNTRPYLESLSKYTEGPYKALRSIFNKFDNKYSAIISRPIWMWGAEMGVNEHGLTIGNEAVFPKGKHTDDALIGMDILRLALHNCKTAKEATEFIIKLIKEYGQGGDGGYKGSLYYDNSFIIKDFSEAYILETASKHWAIKKVKEFGAISNVYSITDDFDEIDEESKNVKNFKESYEDKSKAAESKGDYRWDFAMNFLKSFDDDADIDDMKAYLRAHTTEDNKPRPGLESICIHPGTDVIGETTSSMVVDYIKDKCIIWFTATSHPCVSLFKPIIFTERGTVKGFNDIDFTLKYHKKRLPISKKLVEDYELFLDKVKPIRDKYEAKFKNIIYENIEGKSDKKLLADCTECLKLSEEYLEDIREYI